LCAIALHHDRVEQAVEADRFPQRIEIPCVERASWLLGIRSDLFGGDADQRGLGALRTAGGIEQRFEAATEPLAAEAAGRGGGVAHAGGMSDAPTASRRRRWSSGAARSR